jgi:hypothetical protein
MLEERASRGIVGVMSALEFTIEQSDIALSLHERRASCSLESSMD